MGNDDETIGLILGNITAFILAVIIFEVFYILHLLGTRERFWNLANAMQAKEGRVTLEKWKTTFTITGHGVSTSEIIALLSDKPYAAMQPPRRADPDHTAKMVKYEHEVMMTPQVIAYNNAEKAVQTTIRRRRAERMDITAADIINGNV